MNNPNAHLQSDWQLGELEQAAAQYVFEEVLGTPLIQPALRELAHELEIGSSRNIYHLPINLFLRNETGAMLAVSRIASAAVHYQGLDCIDPASMPLVVRVDELPEQFYPPGGTRDRMQSDKPIGYLRAERTGSGLNLSVGALDFETKTHFSVPLN